MRSPESDLPGVGMKVSYFCSSRSHSHCVNWNILDDFKMLECKRLMQVSIFRSLITKDPEDKHLLCCCCCPSLSFSIQLGLVEDWG